MRYVASGIFVIAVFILVTGVTGAYDSELNPFMYEYIIENFESDTHAQNAVAAILLNYRMYDTMFEALILLTAIIGMKQFLPGARHLPAGDKPDAARQSGRTNREAEK